MSYCPVAAAEYHYNHGGFDQAVEAEIETMLRDEDLVAEMAGSLLEDIAKGGSAAFDLTDIAYALFKLGGLGPFPYPLAQQFRDAVIDRISEEACARVEEAN